MKPWPGAARTRSSAGRSAAVEFPADDPLHPGNCLPPENEAPRMTATNVTTGLRRTTGVLLIGSALTFGTAATVLSSTFDWPDVLREPAEVVLPAFVAGGAGLVWTWFATAWTYGLLLVPILMLPTVLGRRADP